MIAATQNTLSKSTEVLSAVYGVFMCASQTELMTSRDCSSQGGLAMATQTMRSFRLKACARCGGDAYLDLRDDPEWRCLQCGRLVLAEVAPIWLAATETQQQKAA